jgi:hypothetical protein
MSALEENRPINESLLAQRLGDQQGDFVLDHEDDGAGFPRLECRSKGVVGLLVERPEAGARLERLVCVLRGVWGLGFKVWGLGFMDPKLEPDSRGLFVSCAG